MDADLCICGNDDAGFSAAMAGVALGLRVVLVDEGQRNGSWRDWAIVLGVLHRSGLPHRSVPEGRQAWLAFQAEVADAMVRAAPEQRLSRFGALGVRILRGRPAFADHGTLEVGGERIRARRFLLAPHQQRGSENEGAADDVLSRLCSPSEMPADAVVAGGDALSVALAQGLSRLGCAVTLQTPDGVLPRFDPEAVDLVRRALFRDGVNLVETLSNQAVPITGSEVFATRSSPSLENLRLDKAGIITDGQRLILSPALRTTNKRVYAAGAVAGAGSLTEAQAQATLVMKSAFFRLPVCYDASQVPACVLTNPALAAVGLTEDEARGHGLVRVWRWPFADTVAGAVTSAAGFTKVVTTARGRVLGATIVHPEAADHIAYWSLAVRSRRTLAHLAAVPSPAPALAEAFQRLALLSSAEQLRHPWVRRALQLIGLLG